MVYVGYFQVVQYRRPCPANIRLGEDVLKTSWRRLEDVFSVSFFCLPRCLEDVLKTSWKHNCKTSWRRLQDILGRRIPITSWRRLQDVFKTSWKTKSVTLKTAWRRVEDVLENKKCLLGVFLLKSKVLLITVYKDPIKKAKYNTLCT